MRERKEKHLKTHEEEWKQNTEIKEKVDVDGRGTVTVDSDEDEEDTGGSKKKEEDEDRERVPVRTRFWETPIPEATKKAVWKSRRVWDWITDC